MAIHKLASFPIFPFLYLAPFIVAMPSSEYGSIDENNILPLGGSVDLDTASIEFRGVYSGRRVRYNSFIALGYEKNDKGGCCPIGMKANQVGNGCECPEGKKPKPGGLGCDDDTDSSRKGNCPDGQVLDPKEGNKPDDPNPKCQIDDEKHCKKPKIPATRTEGYETDSSYKPDCGEPMSEHERPRCKAKTHYAYTWVDTDGVAHEECQKTKRFQEHKRSRVKELSAKFKEKWYKQTPQREQQKKDRANKLDKLKEHRDKLQKEMEEREKLKEQNDKKKARMGKCSTVTALIMGVAQNTAQKRDEDHPYDMTSNFFDEEFFTSDERLADWPNDVDIDTVACVSDNCVDAEAYMKYWEETAQSHDLKNWPTCGQISGRNLNARCRKRSPFELANNTSSPSFTVGPYATRSAGEPNAIEERNPVVAFQILLEIGLFGTRLGMSLIARTATSVARWAPRLADIAKNTDRLFKLAPKGQGTPKGLEGMKEGFRRIVQNPAFKQCLKDGVP
ncbi:hypothetical protein SLS60_006842 [Paraconiothyrium brasiliense]|uniref:Uncharacterized protein n=1 Tax=Paraconiothyrium brasiliense TaxID=300254 RepID=A0ABR3R7Q5_9PLEO